MRCRSLRSPVFTDGRGLKPIAIAVAKANSMFARLH